jgi:hypothetical protein
MKSNLFEISVNSDFNVKSEVIVSGFAQMIIEKKYGIRRDKPNDRFE